MARLERLLGLAKMYYEEFVDALEDFEAGRERVYAVERLAQLVAQTVLGFGAVLASRERGVKPRTLEAVARWLAERAELEGELKGFLVGLAGFRNRLVYAYAELDPELELEAFHAIRRLMPRVLERLERLVDGDPCLEEVVPAVRRVAERFGLRYVLVFGSLARRGCGRDVDLAVRFGWRAGLLEAGRLQAELEDAVGAPVDLVVVDYGVDPWLAKTLVDEALIVYGDEEEAMEDLGRLYIEYLDTVEWLRSVQGRRMKRASTTRAPSG